MERDEGRKRPAGRPSKSLHELVRSDTFRPGRHHELLAGDDLQWKSLSRLQDRYRDADHELERVAIAREFKQAIPGLLERRARSKKSLAEVLEKLGPAGSYERAVKLFPRFFRLEDGRPFRLRPHQTEPLKEFLRRDRRGRRVYNTLLYGASRGAGKTPFASGLHIDAITTRELPHSIEIPYVFQVAGAKHQARRGLEYIEDWADSNEELAEWLRVGREIYCPSTRGRGRVLSSDGRLGHGRKFRRGIGDELWLFMTYRETQAWIALQTALHKDPEADLIGISTAGYTRESLLGEMYYGALELPDVQVSKDGCTIIARDPDSGFLMYWIGAPEDADIENPKIVRACNPLVADPDLVLREFLQPGADENELRRLLFNQWTKVKNAWLPTGAWRRCYADVEVPVGAEICVAIDAAYSQDCTAVVFAWVDSKGHIHDRAKIWSTSTKWAAHEYVDGDTLDNEELVEPYIHELASKYRIREIVFDDRYFTNEAKHLARAGFTIAAMYPQSAEMSDAVRATYRVIGETKLHHDGDTVLAAHMEAAARRKVIRGTKEFDAIDKLPGGAKIDGCTATVMATWRALVSDAESSEFVGGVEWSGEEA